MTQTLMTCRPSVGSALEDLLATRFLPKRWARRVWSAADLPPRLERCVAGLVHGCEWRAYGDEDEVFFAIARQRAGDLHCSTSVSLEVFLLDAEAAVYAAGVWQHDPKHGWWLDALIELSYDFEHGWWFDHVAQASPHAKRQFLEIAPPKDAQMEPVRKQR
jgi:hypothetical protein